MCDVSLLEKKMFWIRDEIMENILHVLGTLLLSWLIFKLHKNDAVGSMVEWMYVDTHIDLCNGCGVSAFEPSGLYRSAPNSCTTAYPHVILGR